MASRGFLIRFIDIGLIVLFGFLMISDIDESTRVELGDGSVAELPTEARDEDTNGYIVVAISADGSFLVSDARAPEAEVVRVTSANALARVLETARGVHREEDRETVVLIQPDPASLVQATVDVMDVCDRLAIAKSLRMDIEVSPGAVPGDAP